MEKLTCIANKLCGLFRAACKPALRVKSENKTEISFVNGNEEKVLHKNSDDQDVKIPILSIALAAVAFFTAWAELFSLLSCDD